IVRTWACASTNALRLSISCCWRVSSERSSVSCLSVSVSQAAMRSSARMPILVMMAPGRLCLFRYLWISVRGVAPTRIPGESTRRHPACIVPTASPQMLAQPELCRRATKRALEGVVESRKVAEAGFHCNARDCEIALEQEPSGLAQACLAHKCIRRETADLLEAAQEMKLVHGRKSRQSREGPLGRGVFLDGARDFQHPARSRRRRRRWSSNSG